MLSPPLRLATALAVTLTYGCADGRPTDPPSAEFLVASLDSTYWVTSGAAGVRLRGAPLTLASTAGRFYELFVADDDRSFYDAVLVGQRLYRRDLLTGDSAVVFADSMVPRLATGYAVAHPTEYPLDVDEEPSDDPALVVNAEVELVAVYGPYATYEYHTDVERDGAEGRYVTRRGVVDWRTGRTVVLTALFGDPAARVLIDEGRRRFRAAIDSIRHSVDPRAEDARRSIASFAFDQRSFALTDIDGRPSVAFFVPGTSSGTETGDDPTGLTLPLAPILAPVVPAWWADVRATLAEPATDRVLEWWRGRRYGVIARYADESDATLALVDDARHEWVVGRVQPSVERVLWLDQPPADTATRRALQRAFDESALYDMDARLAKRAVHRRSPGNHLSLASWHLRPRSR